MKKSKNKFIIWIILLVFITLIVQLYISYFANRVDTSSYLSLLKWKWTLNEQFISLEERTALESGDKVRIIWDSSLALIEWWDGSITRLSGNTKLSIGEANVSKDYTKINISFDLISGKTWSNVVSFLGQDSYFKQNFDNVEAWVRGTVFNVDLENDYIHVTDHQVTLTKDDGTQIVVWEDEPFSLESFSFLQFSEFVANIRDKAWQDLNVQFDTEYLGDLKTSFEAELDNNNPFAFLLELFSKKYRILYELDHGQDLAKIEKWSLSLSGEKKEDSYNAVLSNYQRINFARSNDQKLYDTKLVYKKTLLLLSENEVEKEMIIRSTVFDFQDLLKSKNLDNISETLSILAENQEILKKIDVSSIIKSSNFIPEDLQEIFGENFTELKEIFSIDTSNISIDNVVDIKEKAEEKIADGLDTIYNLINQ